MTSIIQFSDIHFGVEDRDAMAAVKAYTDTLKPDCILICGDITQDGKTSEFKAAQTWINSFNVPRLITPGNHDTPVYGILQRLFQPWGRYDRYIAPLSEPFYADKNVMIVTMNTARGVQAKLDWSLGVVDLEILDERINTLHSAEPGSLKMIAVHHPFIYPEISPLDKTTKNGPEGIERLSNANIDAILSGHIHTPFFKDRDPGDTTIMSIGSGTLSTRRRGVPAGFSHIQIDEEKLSVTAVDWIDDDFIPAKPWIKHRSKLGPQEGAT